MNTAKGRLPGLILMLATGALLLGGCTTTPTSPDSHKTGQQLRTETIAAVNAAITASGLPDGWAYDLKPDAPLWNPPTEEFIGAQCSTTHGDGQRFDLDLYHAPVGEALTFANKMGEYWAHQGYVVTAVGDTDLGDDHFTNLRADRADGSLAAAVVGSNILFSISIYSECSTDPTLDMFAGPDGYRTFDLSERDPYHPTTPPTITPYPSR